jgi:hypothetical protein
MGRLIATLPNTPAGDIARRTLISQDPRSSYFDYLDDLRGRLISDAGETFAESMPEPRSAAFLAGLPVSFHELDVHARTSADEPSLEEALINDWKGYHSDPEAVDGERGFILNVELSPFGTCSQVS